MMYSYPYADNTSPLGGKDLVSPQALSLAVISLVMLIGGVATGAHSLFLVAGAAALVAAGMAIVQAISAIAAAGEATELDSPARETSAA